MLIQCIKNKIEDVKGNYSIFHELKETVFLPGNRLEIELLEYYTVYAISFCNGNPEFYIADNAYTNFPHKYSSNFFKIVDKRLSRHWILPDDCPNWESLSLKPINKIITIDAWYNKGDYFYEALINDIHHESMYFLEKKRLMDLEYFHPSVCRSALLLEGRWVQCPLCDEAWEASSIDEITQCFDCNEFLKNPVVTRQNKESDENDE